MMNSLPSPKYHDLRNDIETGDLANTDRHGSVTGYDDGEKDSWRDDITAGEPVSHEERRETRSARVWRRIMSVRSIMDTVLLLVILVLLVERTRGLNSKTAEFELAGDMTGFAPRFKQQIRTFVPDPRFIPENGSEFFTDAVQNRWLGIVPRGLGYVTINDTTPYNNLPTKIETYPDSTFTTSVTHQLHCLHAIIGVVASLTSGEKDKMPSEGAWHLSHCFEYLRQTIMCCGDVALEGQATTFPVGFVGSDGWDAKHVCKDYSQILTYLDDNRANNDRWI